MMLLASAELGVVAMPLRKAFAERTGRCLLKSLLVFVSAFSLLAHARPVGDMGLVPRQLAPQNPSGQGGQNQSNAFSTTVWIPVIVIVVVIVLLLIGSWARKHIFPSNDLPAPANPEVATAGDTSAQRRRRNRRRASQISTRSLPAYMEEPGDEELVLVRRREPMPTVLEANHSRMSMDSDDDLSDDHQHGSPLLERDPHSMPHSAVPMYGSGSDMSQMPDHSAVSLQTQPERDIVDSPSTAHSSDLRNLSSSTSLPAGDAPPYFEAVADERGDVAHRPLERTTTPTPSIGRSPSLFRALFSRNTDGHLGVTQEGEATSTAAPGHRQSSSVSTTRRPSVSLSRIRSIGSRSPEPELGDPVGTRRNISAPLSHTLVRTDFTYPRSGPTQEQVRFISSRESLGRFGLPFGQEAIEHAIEPPAFEAVVGHARRPSHGSLASEVILESPTTGSAADHPPPVPALPAAESSLTNPAATLRTNTLHPLQLPSIVTSHPTPPASPTPLTPVKAPLTPTSLSSHAAVSPAAIPLPPSPAEQRPS